MTTARKAALMCVALGIAFVALEEAAGVRLGLAGIYVVGMAGGIWIGEIMTRESAQQG